VQPIFQNPNSSNKPNRRPSKNPLTIPDGSAQTPKIATNRILKTEGKDLNKQTEISPKYRKRPGTFGIPKGLRELTSRFKREMTTLSDQRLEEKAERARKLGWCLAREADDCQQWEKPNHSAPESLRASLTRSLARSLARLGNGPTEVNKSRRTKSMRTKPLVLVGERHASTSAFSTWRPHRI